MKYARIDAQTAGKVLFLSVVAILLVFVFLHTASSYRGVGGEGMLSGSVSIGPCCPAEQAGNSCCAADIYSSRKLVLILGPGSPAVYVPLMSDGSFNVEVPVGAYNVTLTNCSYPGCSQALPTGVIVTSGKTTVLSISVDTGIR